MCSALFFRNKRKTYNLILQQTLHVKRNLLKRIVKEKFSILLMLHFSLILLYVELGVDNCEMGKINPSYTDLILTKNCSTIEIPFFWLLMNSFQPTSSASLMRYFTFSWSTIDEGKTLSFVLNNSNKFL